MSPWLQRLITVASGIAVGMLGILVPATQPFTAPAAVGLICWAIPHPSDKASP